MFDSDLIRQAEVKAAGLVHRVRANVETYRAASMLLETMGPKMAATRRAQVARQAAAAESFLRKVTVRRVKLDLPDTRPTRGRKLLKLIA